MSLIVLEVLIARSLPSFSRKSLGSWHHLLIIKAFDVRRYRFQTVLDRKVTGVETVHLGRRQVFEISLSALACKKNVVLSPKDQRLGLVIAQEPLPLGIQPDICSVVIKKVHLHAAGVRPVHEAKVHVPVVGTNQFGMFMAMQINGLDRIELQ